MPESDFMLVLPPFDFESDEDEPVLGDAAGLLGDGDDVFPPSTPSFADVSASRRPVAFKPSFC